MNPVLTPFHELTLSLVRFGQGDPLAEWVPGLTPDRRDWSLLDISPPSPHHLLSISTIRIKRPKMPKYIMSVPDLTQLLYFSI